MRARRPRRRRVAAALLLLLALAAGARAQFNASCNAQNNADCPGSEFFQAFDISPPIYAPYPLDLAGEDDVYAGPKNDTDGACATVLNITRDADTNDYIVNIALSLGGAGCRTVLPWTAGPLFRGQTVSGADALTSCRVNATADEGCVRVDPGPSGGIALSFDAPIYRLPLSVATSDGQSEADVPFGYTGYFVYETESRGMCGKYGFTDVPSSQAITSRTGSHIAVSMAFPRPGECGDFTPQAGAFISRFPPIEVADRLAAILRFPLFNANTTQNPWLDVNYGQSTAFIDASNTLVPFGYLDLERVLGIVEPFKCLDTGLNFTAANATNATAAYRIGSAMQEAHSCPMSVAEWQTALQDVVVPGDNVDVFLGPNATTYTALQRDGVWIVPTNGLGSLPVVCYRCAQPAAPGGAGPGSGINYASRHMPISMSFGPLCGAMRARDGRATARVAVGGFAGLLSTADFADDDADNAWLISAGFPVRYVRAIGPTDRAATVEAPGTAAVGLMDADFLVTDGTSGRALRFDPDVLRYVLCNGGGGVIMPAGINSTTGQRFGPLVSAPDLDALSGGPAWPNPFRLAEPANNTNCAGCTYPSIATQRGWTVIDAQIWRYGQGPEAGKYHADHSLWQRILALVNATEALLGGEELNIFGVWNASYGTVNSYADAAAALRQFAQSEFLPDLPNSGIPGIGPEFWTALACDYMRFSGRPAPFSGPNFRTQGTAATPMCWMFQRQLYAQTLARLFPGNLSLSTGLPTPDLDSAQRTGVFNRLAPNVWFGIWQRPAVEGGPAWYAFMDDTWDITGGSPISDDGMAAPVESTLTLRVPSALVDVALGPATSILVASGIECGVPSPDPLGSIYQAADVAALFDAPDFGAQAVRFVVDVVNCAAPAQFDQTAIEVVTEPASFAVFSSSLTDPDPVTGQRALVLDVTYDTVGIEVVYAARVPFTCGALLAPTSPLGFTVAMSYLQFVAPLPEPLKDIALEATGTVACVGVPANETQLGQFDAYDFRQVAPPAADLPLDSFCVPVFPENPLDVEAPVSSGPLNRTGTFPANLSQAVLWECVTAASIDAYGEFSFCNVSGAGNRTGNCTQVEQMLDYCREWWNLSCSPLNSEQVTFLYAITIGLVFLASLIAVVALAVRGRERFLESLVPEDMAGFNKDVHAIERGALRERYESGRL